MVLCAAADSDLYRLSLAETRSVSASIRFHRAHYNRHGIGRSVAIQSSSTLNFLDRMGGTRRDETD